MYKSRRPRSRRYRIRDAARDTLHRCRSICNIAFLLLLLTISLSPPSYLDPKICLTEVRCWIDAGGSTCMHRWDAWWFTPIIGWRAGTSSMKGPGPGRYIYIDRWMIDCLGLSHQERNAGLTLYQIGPPFRRGGPCYDLCFENTHPVPASQIGEHSASIIYRYT